MVSEIAAQIILHGHALNFLIVSAMVTNHCEHYVAAELDV
jgi:hypothetical protein